MKSATYFQIDTHTQIYTYVYMYVHKEGDKQNQKIYLFVSLSEEYTDVHCTSFSFSVGLKFFNIKTLKISMNLDVKK